MKIAGGAAGLMGVVVIVTACSGGGASSTSPPSSTTDPRYIVADTGGPACTADADCDDSVYCNGDELCIPGDSRANRRGCVRPLPDRRCPSGATCIESSHRCACDADGDGHDAIACGGDDCDDGNPNRYPGNPEVCDSAGHDEDCNPTTLGTRDDPDHDHDGFVSISCCDMQPSGVILCGSDCNDNEATVHPGAPEECDGIDNDCNGMIDEGTNVLYPDADHDGFGVMTGAITGACTEKTGYSPLDNDCDDTNDAMFPGQFKCVSAPALGTDYLLCNGATGAFDKGTCAAQGQCHPQPNGTGVCL